ncbi:MAG: hypothetical protein H6625_04945 [Bdellovibrionaceae bacterium]|nr:hypothetical protein [Pseudobdellovibrionaceae bacterium]
MRGLKNKQILNKRGMATFEAIPMIVIFVMLVGYALGLWGVVHSSTLHSIGARQYAFETLRNRSNYMFFRDKPSESATLYHSLIGYRYHAITVNVDGGRFNAPNVPITIGKKPVNKELLNLNTQNRQLHNQGIFELEQRNQKVEFSHAWIMSGYGICINPACGAPE